jgi:hypothetical protein
LGTVSATDTFDLDTTINKISNEPDDYVRINHTDGIHFTDYSTVEPKRLKRYPRGEYCAKVGKTLKFNKAFTAINPQFGGHINVPAYLSPPLLKNAKDTVPVDDPNWLLLICAAEWTRTDITLSQNYSNLINEVNESMIAMKQANQAQLETVPLEPVARGQEW